MIFILFIVILILFIIWAFPRVNKAIDRERQRTANYRSKANGKPFCPKCGCTELSANNKGYSTITGTLNSKDVYVTCLKCGHRWKAGDYKYLY